MSKNRNLVYSLVLYFACPVAAQVLPLDSVKKIILLQNPEIRMYLSKAKASDAMSEGATAWEAPELAAGFFMTPYQTSKWRPQTFKVDGMNERMPGMGNFMIQARQMIPNPGRLRAGKDYQKAMAAVESENGRTAANNLIYLAKILYYECQITDRKLKVLDEARMTLQTMIRLGEKKIAYNQESVSGVLKAKAQEAMLEKDKWMMEGQRSQKLNILKGLMNHPGDELFAPDTSFTLKEYDKAPVDSAALTLNRSDISSVNKNIQAALLKQKTELAKSRPGFGIEYGHMFAFGDNPNQFTLMGMMSIPIAPWSSGMYRSGAKAALLEAEAMKNQKEAMISESLAMVRGLKSEMASADYQLKLYRETVLPSLTKAWDVAMLAYSGNSGELFMALDARMNLQMAQMQYWDAVLNLLKLQAEYEKQLQIF